MLQVIRSRRSLEHGSGAASDSSAPTGYAGSEDDRDEDEHAAIGPMWSVVAPASSDDEHAAGEPADEPDGEAGFASEIGSVLDASGGEEDVGVGATADALSSLRLRSRLGTLDEELAK